MCHPFDSRNSKPSRSVVPLMPSLFETMDTSSSRLTKRLFSRPGPATGLAMAAATINAASSFTSSAVRFTPWINDHELRSVEERGTSIVRSVFGRAKNRSIGTLDQGREFRSCRDTDPPLQWLPVPRADPGDTAHDVHFRQCRPTILAATDCRGTLWVEAKQPYRGGSRARSDMNRDLAAGCGHRDRDLAVLGDRRLRLH